METYCKLRNYPGASFCENNPHDCEDVQKAHDEGIAQGRALERSAIVKWLQDEAAGCSDAWGPGSPGHDALFSAADEIERGEHVKEGA